MRRRFTIAAYHLTEEQEKALIAFLQSHECAWWHWLRGFWLAVDLKGQLTCTSIRDQLSLIAPSARTFVVDATESRNWAGFGPTRPGKDMFDWLHKVWNQP